MAFDSFGAFLSMEGHGPYVWACYITFFAVLVPLMFGSYRRRAAAMESCRRGFEMQEGGKGGKASAGSSATFSRVTVSHD